MNLKNKHGHSPSVLDQDIGSQCRVVLVFLGLITIEELPVFSGVDPFYI